ncbi:hypothetical protein C7964_10715 [Loktanella sp. PT4BL]|jgi:hypothetical protein|nr:hypothetical protein C7964_10715 [Loktanella sp. PT4BL]
MGNGGAEPPAKFSFSNIAAILGFDCRTAMQLVHEGKAQQVLEYTDVVDAGVFA